MFGTVRSAFLFDRHTKNPRLVLIGDFFYKWWSGEGFVRNLAQKRPYYLTSRGLKRNAYASMKVRGRFNAKVR